MAEKTQYTPTNAVNAIVKDYDTLKQMEFDGQLKPFSNYFVKDEDVNLSQLRTEVVYDMTSGDANKNWGYKTGILGGVTIDGKDFSKYNKLIIHSYNLDNALTLIYDLDFVEPNTQSVAGLSYDNKAVMQLKCSVNSSRTSFTVNDVGYFNTSGYTNRNDNTSYFVYKIEGVITRQPAMIYTGSELHEGNGISIENGVISANKQIKLLWENPNPTSNYSSGTINLNSSDYDFLIFVTLGYKDNRRDPQFARKGESVRSWWIDNTGYYNTSGDSILRIYRDITYVNDTTYTVNGCQARNWMSQSSAANRTGFNDVLIPQYVLGVKL